MEKLSIEQQIPMAREEKTAAWKPFVAGATAGACEAIGTMPLDVIKTNMQIHAGLYRNPLHAGKEIYLHGGFRALYFGLSALLIQTSGKAAIRFTAYEQICSLLKLFGMDRKEKPKQVGLIAGLGAGTAEALIWTTPTERLKVLRQKEASLGTNKYASLFGGMSNVLKESGIRGLYAGALPTAMRQSSSVGIRFMLLADVKKLLSNVVSPDSQAGSTFITLLSGGTVGAISVCVNNPVDVIKSKQQASEIKLSFVDCAHTIHHESGWKGFFRGLSVRAPRVFLAQSLTFVVFEGVSNLLKFV